MSAIVFVVVISDRHTDDEIAVCATEQGAGDVVLRLQNLYGSRYRWLDRHVPESHARLGLVRIADTDYDDGPTITVTRCEVRP